MKIVLFTETFLPKIDGVVNTLCQLLRHLEKRGHEAVVVAPGNGPEIFASARVIYHRGVGLPMYPEVRVVSPFTAVSAPLRGFRPDLVHVANPVMLGVAGTRWAERSGFPVIASFHTDVPGYARTYGFPALTRPLWGYPREELQRLFAGTPTVLAGYLQGEELASAYASADIFAFPSASETFGNVVLEAAASGLPAVAPGAGGVVDIISNGETGFLFEAHSRKAFCDSVRRLVRDLGKRREMSAKARSMAEGRSWETVLDGLLEEYHRVAGLPPPSGETATFARSGVGLREVGLRCSG